MQDTTMTFFMFGPVPCVFCERFSACVVERGGAPEEKRMYACSSGTGMFCGCVGPRARSVLHPPHHTCPICVPHSVDGRLASLVAPVFAHGDSRTSMLYVLEEWSMHGSVFHGPKWMHKGLEYRDRLYLLGLLTYLHDSVCIPQGRIPSMRGTLIPFQHASGQETHVADMNHCAILFSVHAKVLEGDFSRACLRKYYTRRGLVSALSEDLWIRAGAGDVTSGTTGRCAFIVQCLEWSPMRRTWLAGAILAGGGGGSPVCRPQIKKFMCAEDA